jgi:hypothetical protein
VAAIVSVKSSTVVDVYVTPFSVHVSIVVVVSGSLEPYVPITSGTNGTVGSTTYPVLNTKRGVGAGSAEPEPLPEPLPDDMVMNTGSDCSPVLSPRESVPAVRPFASMARPNALPRSSAKNPATADCGAATSAAGARSLPAGRPERVPGAA